MTVSAEPLAPQDALVAVMIAMSVADGKIKASETAWITAIVGQLPVFEGYDIDRLPYVSGLVEQIFEEDEGIDALVGLVANALPDHLRETAYALACDVAAADGQIPQTELRLLEIIRYDLSVGRLAAAAIERGARARHQALEPRN